MLRIKELLYEEGFTIAGAKKRLETELSGRGATPGSMASGPEGMAATDPRGATRPGDPPQEDKTRAVLGEVRTQLRELLTLLDKGDRKSV